MGNYIITISRRFASKSHEIAGIMSSALDIPVYDRSAVEARVQSLKGAENTFSPEEGDRGYTRQEGTARGLFGGLLRREVREGMRDEAQLEFERQSEVIRALAEEGSCIILGRCADQLFEDHPRAFHVYIYASMEARIRNTMQMLHTGEEAARALVQNEDRTREAYRRRFSAHPEDEVAGRHILIDSGKIGVEKSADILIQAAKYLFYQE